MFSFLRNRPPLTVFLLCIVTVTVTISCFAFYIKNTDPVPDSDRQHDWFELLKHFNSLDGCIHESSNEVEKKDDDGKFVAMTKVQTLISINTDAIRKISSVRGSLTLDDWHTNCPKNNPKPSSLPIYFDVPKDLNTDVSKIDICVTIEGPEEYLPKFSEPNCNITAEKVTKPAAYLSTTSNKYDEKFCEEGSLTKLKFYPQTMDNLASYLSDAEKSIIYFHLLWTSYVLLFIVLIIVIYGTLQSDYFYDSVLHRWIPFQKK